MYVEHIVSLLQHMLFLPFTYCLPDMHEIKMLFQISLLREAFVALGAPVRLDSAMKPNVVFDVAGLIEGLVTAVDHALVVQFILQRFLIEDSGDLVVLLVDVFEGSLLDVEVLVVHDLMHLVLLFLSALLSDPLRDVGEGMALRW